MQQQVKTQVKSINVFSFLFLLTLLSMMGYEAYNIMLLRLLSYASECTLITYAYFNGLRKGGNYSPIAIFVATILLLNFILTPNTPEYTDLLKYFGYYGCFIYGSSLARHYNHLSVNNVLLYMIVIVPAVLVAFFDNTVLKNFFFHSPNGFVYLGVSIGAFYLVVNGREKKYFIRAIIVSAFYILICTSLGVVVASFLSVLLLNFKKTHIPYIIVGGLIGIIAVSFIDIPLFVRIRDVLNVWQYVFDSKVGSIEDVDFYELNQIDRAGERNDSTSSVWRIVQWTKIFKMYIEEIWTIPFGMGAGYSVKVTGLYPHNDYLLILVEYGLIVFSFFCRFVFFIYKKLKNEGMIIYFILAMLLYHLTENLLSNFPPGAILYFLSGWSLYKYGEIKNSYGTRRVYTKAEK